MEFLVSRVEGAVRAVFGRAGQSPPDPVGDDTRGLVYQAKESESSKPGWLNLYHAAAKEHDRLMQVAPVVPASEYKSKLYPAQPGSQPEQVKLSSTRIDIMGICQS